MACRAVSGRAVATLTVRSVPGLYGEVTL